MAATVKTLLDNPGELYWGTRNDEPEYHYGIALDFREGILAAQLVFVLTDCDEETEADLVTPDILMSCFTVADLENAGILLSDNMDESPEDTLGWYCIELSVFNQNELDALKENNARLDECLDTVVQILSASSDELDAPDSFLNEYTFFNLLEELCALSDKIDRGEFQQPLPFQFRLIGDALLGWQFTSEEVFK